MRKILLPLLLLGVSCGSDVVYRTASYELLRDGVTQAQYTARVLSDTEIVSDFTGAAPGADSVAEQRWRLGTDISAYPRLSEGLPVERAMYNLSLDEVNRAVEPDSTLRTGRNWSGVWTRDVSYSILLAMAHVQPEVAKKSLMRKVDPLGRIVQDTGTGGAWPVSSDRMIWAVAAYEVYKVTGDEAWLDTIWPVIRRSVEDDMRVVYDPVTQLVRGESSFLDWREQEYPRWMQPADIYASENLGTCAVHCRACEVLAEIAARRGEAELAARYARHAGLLREGINARLWIEERGYYGQFLYGRDTLLLSPRSETLGEALCILWDIAPAERAARVVEQVPSLDFGTPCFFPSIPDVPPYHNDAVWPFVQAYWTLAAARTGNEPNVLHGIGAIWRAGLLFLTNQENFVSWSGDRYGTQINSANMLWSLSGNLALTYRLLFGLDFEADGLRFAPFVPEALDTPRRLENFRYREALLDISLSGWGNRIASFRVDGVEQEPFLADTLRGRHAVEIRLASEPLPAGRINLTANRYSPRTPEADFGVNRLLWEPEQGCTYRIYRDGTPVGETSDAVFPLPDDETGSWQVTALSADGIESFASEPVASYRTTRLYEAEEYAPAAAYPYSGYSGRGFVEIARTVNRRIEIPIRIGEPGEYVLAWRYANGNGSVETHNRCALRTMRVDGAHARCVVFPQRGEGAWDEWGLTNRVRIALTPGRHVVTLEFCPWNENMHMEVNQAMVDCLVVSRAD